MVILLAVIVVVGLVSVRRGGSRGETALLLERSFERHLSAGDTDLKRAQAGIRAALAPSRGGSNKALKMMLHGE